MFWYQLYSSSLFVVIVGVVFIIIISYNHFNKIQQSSLISSSTVVSTTTKTITTNTTTSVYYSHYYDDNSFVFKDIWKEDVIEQHQQQQQRQQQQQQKYQEDSNQQYAIQKQRQEDEVSVQYLRKIELRRGESNNDDFTTWSRKYMKSQSPSSSSSSIYPLISPTLLPLFVSKNISNMCNIDIVPPPPKPQLPPNDNDAYEQWRQKYIYSTPHGIPLSPCHDVMKQQKLFDNNNTNHNDTIIIIFGGYILFTISSLLSIFGSLTIVYSSHQQKLDSIYQRLIYIISCCDLLTSISFILHPYMLPKYLRLYRIPWASGNITSCSIAGFIFVLGPLLITFYTFYLILYFYVKVKYNINDIIIKKYYQYPFHIIAILISFTIPCIGLYYNGYKPRVYSSLCNLGIGQIGNPGYHYMYQSQYNDLNARMSYILFILQYSLIMFIALISLYYTFGLYYHVRLTLQKNHKYNSIEFIEFEQQQQKQQQQKQKQQSDEIIDNINSNGNHYCHDHTTNESEDWNYNTESNRRRSSRLNFLFMSSNKSMKLYNDTNNDDTHNDDTNNDDTNNDDTNHDHTNHDDTNHDHTNHDDANHDHTNHDNESKDNTNDYKDPISSSHHYHCDHNESRLCSNIITMDDSATISRKSLMMTMKGQTSGNYITTSSPRNSTRRRGSMFGNSRRNLRNSFMQRKYRANIDKKLIAVRNQALLYALSYWISFILIFMISILFVFIQKKETPLSGKTYVAFTLLIYFLYPLQGFMNCFVYTRPRYLEYRRSHYDRYYSFIMALTCKPVLMDAKYDTIYQQRNLEKKRRKMNNNTKLTETTITTTAMEVVKKRNNKTKNNNSRRSLVSSSSRSLPVMRMKISCMNDHTICSNPPSSSDIMEVNNSAFLTNENIQEKNNIRTLRMKSCSSRSSSSSISSGDNSIKSIYDGNRKRDDSDMVIQALEKNGNTSSNSCNNSSKDIGCHRHLQDSSRLSNTGYNLETIQQHQIDAVKDDDHDMIACNNGNDDIGKQPPKKLSIHERNRYDDNNHKTSSNENNNTTTSTKKSWSWWWWNHYIISNKIQEKKTPKRKKRRKKWNKNFTEEDHNNHSAYLSSDFGLIDMELVDLLHIDDHAVDEDINNDMAFNQPHSSTMAKRKEILKDEEQGNTSLIASTVEKNHCPHHNIIPNPKHKDDHITLGDNVNDGNSEDDYFSDSRDDNHDDDDEEDDNFDDDDEENEYDDDSDEEEEGVDYDNDEDDGNEVVDFGDSEQYDSNGCNIFCEESDEDINNEDHLPSSLLIQPFSSEFTTTINNYDEDRNQEQTLALKK